MKKRLQKISKYRPSVFQGTIDFSSATRGFSLTHEHPAEQRLFHILCILLATLLCGYLYFVSASVLNIIARKEASAHIASIQGSIAVLEQQYFALNESVDERSAQTLGLAPIERTEYVYVPGPAAAAQLPDQI